MPYVKQEQREYLESTLVELAGKIRDLCEDDTNNWPGLLNYCFTRTITKTLKINMTNGLKYFIIALVTGVLENVKQEFYRRLATPYENKKSEENGDVY